MSTCTISKKGLVHIPGVSVLCCREFFYANLCCHQKPDDGGQGNIASSPGWLGGSPAPLLASSREQEHKPQCRTLEPARPAQGLICTFST
ncbi:hypothetical protein GDO81_017133 [Engystomops pustulosus]|uniref:Uncharacterized protein n=1 Tax=Engystomops pustulosus TaxID=76066 RepID=A0AAV7ABL2_ENGPU|nr:hypothetical protein GDO81_017133 [Engystomops pustulosus]